MRRTTGGLRPGQHSGNAITRLTSFHANDSNSDADGILADDRTEFCRGTTHGTIGPRRASYAKGAELLSKTRLIWAIIYLTNHVNSDIFLV